MVQGGMTIVRYVTFAFNFIFVICGIALIVVGALANHYGKNIALFLGPNIPASSILVIIAGCIILILAFLGCCGALKENYCMLMTFSVLLFLLFVIEVAAGITGVIYRAKIQEIIHDNMENSIKDYGKKNDSDVKKSWDYIQQEFHCCGVQNASDWLNAIEHVPDSCCKKDKNCSVHASDLFKEGCFDMIKDKVKQYQTKIIVAAFVIAFIQLLGLIFGCCLAHAIKKEYETV